MTAKFNNKYRTESHRRPGWKYDANANYFITIVTQHRKCNLGQIENRKMILSNFGKIVQLEWQKSFEIRDELTCDEYIIMPNHIHALIEIKKLDKTIEIDSLIDLDDIDDSIDLDDIDDSIDLDDIAEQTHGRASLRQSNRQMPNRLPQSISSFIAGFKSSVNSKIDDYIDIHHLNIPKYNRNNHFFQPNYHDRIVRTIDEYFRIKHYIINNPAKWNSFKNN